MKLKAVFSSATTVVLSGQGWERAVNREKLPSESFKIQNKIKNLRASEGEDLPKSGQKLKEKSEFKEKAWNSQEHSEQKS